MLSLPARAWIIGAAFGVFLFGCAKPPAITVGGLYSVKDDAGHYRAAKVIAVDNDGVHIRLYKNTWPQRPNDVPPKSLSLGTINDPDGFGIGHMALSEKDFRARKPVFLSSQPLSKDELEGYRLWKQGKTGNFFGK